MARNIRAYLGILTEIFQELEVETVKIVQLINQEKIKYMKIFADEEPKTLLIMKYKAA